MSDGAVTVLVVDELHEAAPVAVAMPNPNPRPGPVLSVATADTYQKPWCGHRATCLRAVAGAASLDCRACDAFEPLQGEELAAEVAGLCAIGRVLERLRAAPDEELPRQLRRPTPRSRADGNRTVRPERSRVLDDAAGLATATARAAALELVESQPGVPQVDAGPIVDAADAVDVAAPGEAA